MSDTENHDTAALASAQHARTSTPDPTNPNRVAALAARHKSNTSTPRTNRTNGSLIPVTVLRKEIALQMDGEFVECSVDEFISHYLPFNPDDGDIKKFVKDATSAPEPMVAPTAASAMGRGKASRTATRNAALPPRQLPKSSVLEKVNGVLRFTDYPDHLLPVTPNEMTTYSYLQKILDAIGGMTVAGRTRNGFLYRACPNTMVKSETPGSNNKIDGCIISDSYITPNGDLDLKATGIAVAFEFKLETSKVIENNNQVVSANVQIMDDDVRRMFTYGVTIIGKMVRLWYHGRSHSAVSELFDFVKNPKLFIKVMASFLFATEVELGYDPKVKRMPDNRLVFEMADDNNKPIFYRTVRTLSEYRSNNITGRMSRVWEVELVPNSDGTGDAESRAVLKDVWLDEDAPTEREVQEAIYKAIEDRKADIDSHKGIGQVMGSAKLLKLINSGDYKKFFLTIVADWVGRSSKKVAPGARRRLGLLLSAEVKAVTILSKGVNVDRVQSSTPQPTQLEQDTASRRTFIPRQWKVKRQSRTVSAELCVTVGRMRTMGEVLDVLSQALTALRILYFAGWVHRDISSGNIMACQSGGNDGTPPWQAKLCDLEYAKEYTTDPSATSQDPKTGTPYFMANEILWNKALLPATQAAPAKKGSTSAPPPPLSVEDREIQAIERRRARTEAFKAKLTTQGQRQGRSMNVIPNFQHDLESIFWLTIYSATARADHPPSNTFASNIFKHTTELSIDRAVCLTDSIGKELEECLHPDLVQIADTLEELRTELLSEYHHRNTARLQNGTSDDTESFVNIINEFYVSFYDLVSAASTDDKLANFPLINETKNVDVPVVVSAQSKKRARSIRDDDDYRAKSDDGEEEEEDTEPKPKKKKKSGAKKLKKTGKA